MLLKVMISLTSIRKSSSMLCFHSWSFVHDCWLFMIVGCSWLLFYVTFAYSCFSSQHLFLISVHTIHTKHKKVPNFCLSSLCFWVDKSFIQHLNHIKVVVSFQDHLKMRTRLPDFSNFKVAHKSILELCLIINKKSQWWQCTQYM